MRFSKVDALRVPNGNARRIRHNGKVLWSPALARYVSLGDSIAAGHSIDSDWEKDYGRKSQYGENGNTETVIVPNCYTDLIRRDLITRYGGKVNATSFARSGDRVDDLMQKLDHDVVRNAIAKADYVTICIGANDVLEPALSHLEQYIEAGDSALAEIAATVEANLENLANDSYAYSYTALFKKLNAINPNAKYVFTTIYNPYKYLWVQKGTWDAEYKDSFFAPIFEYIPEMSTLGYEWDRELKKALLNTSMISTLFDRVNGLDDWAEKYVTRLNTVLRNKIAAYGKANFMLADTKAVYDPVPDRPITAPKHYNDLVNVEFTRGYTTGTMDWGALWRNNVMVDKNGNTVVCNDPNTFWDILLGIYMDGLNVDYEGLANALVNETVEDVIVPNVDPHPETYGHYALERSFADALGWSTLPRRTITFNANGGSGAMATQTVVALDNMVAYTNLTANAFTIGTEGYHFVGWNTASGGNGTAYSDGQLVGISGNLTLYAQWSNMYTIRYRHTNHTSLYSDDETGHKECYALTIAGETKRKLGTFASDSGDTYSYPYGTQVTVMVTDYHGADDIDSTFYDHHDGRVYLNGVEQAVGRPATWSFNLTGNVDIDFRWKIAGSLVTFDAQSWEDCHITTL